MSPALSHTLDSFVAQPPRHDSFVGIDSDGCVFDTMEIKQKQCFHGLIVSHWGLEAIESALRETAEFVNLYSRWRGQNRFLALIRVFDLLPTHPAVRRAALPLPAMPALRALAAETPNITETVLRDRVARGNAPELQGLLAWSEAVNAAIARTVKRIPPFPWARRSLERLQGRSDAVCVSQTPIDALIREWGENDLAHLLAAIAGQEQGTKTEQLARASQGRYAPGRVLMIGDALGDYQAARANQALFYPILPADEDASWQRFHDDAYGRFLAGAFAGDYQEALLDAFLTRLPEHPSWAADPPPGDGVPVNATATRP